MLASDRISYYMVLCYVISYYVILLVLWSEGEDALVRGESSRLVGTSATSPAVWFGLLCPVDTRVGVEGKRERGREM